MARHWKLEEYMRADEAEAAAVEMNLSLHGKDLERLSENEIDKGHTAGEKVRESWNSSPLVEEVMALSSKNDMQLVGTAKEIESGTEMQPVGKERQRGNMIDGWRAASLMELQNDLDIRMVDKAKGLASHNH